ncbi:hypothetical protein EGR_07713 [Echinococcus granulosus]|uniref:Uncharacterized protein n=1 Tax=Echinococcus granulosus TaxID=6210 RepID=W6UAD3_ECHGR|nr:hypothetical protein EGR_07713 [Echinococcus granulosus]EUB57471.1 hypothetical protein EGR_07713 [Echinococcus granulosus]
MPSPYLLLIYGDINGRQFDVADWKADGYFNGSLPYDSALRDRSLSNS